MVEKKIAPYKITKLGIKFNGKNVIQQSFKGRFTKDEIVNYVQKRSNEYKTKGMNAQIQIVPRFHPGKKGWRADIFTNVGEQVRFYDGSDWYEQGEDETPEEFSEFRIMIQKI